MYDQDTSTHCTHTSRFQILTSPSPSLILVPSSAAAAAWLPNFDLLPLIQITDVSLFQVEQQRLCHRLGVLLDDAA